MTAKANPLPVHSPLPWPTPWLQGDPIKGPITIWAHPHAVASVYRKEDAALIVTAVNSHAALVSALKAMINDEKGSMKIYDMARAALKLAGEEI